MAFKHMSETNKLFHVQVITDVLSTKYLTDMLAESSYSSCQTFTKTKRDSCELL